MAKATYDAEINRLVSNQRSFLQAIPEPIMVINGQEKIEYMNDSAVSFFSRCASSPRRKKLKNESLQRYFLKRLHESTPPPHSAGVYQFEFERQHLQFVTAPFHGYNEEQLHWLILRDVTTQKKHETELSRVHNNIETVLKNRIQKLKIHDSVRKKLKKQIIDLKKEVEPPDGEDTMIGSSTPMRQLRELISQVSGSEATILITGESGTGKELVANLIRDTSDRKKKPFLKINCSTISDSLLESDLFGYEKGSFTGAHRRRQGKFEVVDGGTIFLDEIGDISPRMQAALLRVLQDGEIIRVGGNTPIKVDVRIIAATNKNLSLAVKKGHFRLDLYYRLNIINIAIPPLRERREDIEDLVYYFTLKYSSIFKKDVQYLARPILDNLINHDWPGNIRELENVIQRAVLLAKDSLITEQEIFFDYPAGANIGSQMAGLVEQKGDNDRSLKSILASVERVVLQETLKKYQGSVAKAARELGLGKTAFYDKLKKFKIASRDYR